MDFSSVKGKVVIVTGASRGIGEAIAKVYGEHGMKVVCAARSKEQGQAVADEICAKGGDAIFVQTDCSDAAQIRALVDTAVEHYGKLDGLVSNAGIVPQRGQALYTATKHGVIGMTKSGAMDYAPYGITVNAICPGYTRTSIFGNAPEQALAMFAKDCPAGRMGNPEECAYLALFLASDMARYITGAAIPVDGALAAGHQNVSTWKHPEIRE
ncbi:MAG: SDR family NAD(P)-dependent oxidoreductase [Oliverpabstia sp.]